MCVVRVQIEHIVRLRTNEDDGQPPAMPTNYGSVYNALVDAN